MEVVEKTIEKLALEDAEKYQNSLFSSLQASLLTIFPGLEGKTFQTYPSIHKMYKENKYHLVSFEDSYFLWVGEYPNFQVYSAKRGLFGGWKIGKRILRISELYGQYYVEKK